MKGIFTSASQFLQSWKRCSFTTRILHAATNSILTAIFRRLYPQRDLTDPCYVSNVIIFPARNNGRMGPHRPDFARPHYGDLAFMAFLCCTITKYLQVPFQAVSRILFELFIVQKSFLLLQEIPQSLLFLRGRYIANPSTLTVQQFCHRVPILATIHFWLPFHFWATFHFWPRSISATAFLHTMVVPDDWTQFRQ